MIPPCVLMFRTLKPARGPVGVIRVIYEPWRVVGHVRNPPKPNVASTKESFVDRGRWRTAKAWEKNKADWLAKAA